MYLLELFEHSYVNKKLINADKLTQLYPNLSIDEIINKIKNKDPSPNDSYTNWLIKMVTNKSISINDINEPDYLTQYHIRKIKNKLLPEFNNILSFKTYQDMIDAVQNSTTPEKNLPNKGDYTLEYKDNNVKIYSPHDKSAACYLGQNTKWCTSATKSYNEFDDYIKKGPIYILIPTKPQYTGEKYQVQAESNQLKNELDDAIPNPYQFLTNRFPNVINVLFKLNNNFKNLPSLFNYDDIITKFKNIIIQKMNSLMQQNPNNKNIIVLNNMINSFIKNVLPNMKTNNPNTTNIKDTIHEEFTEFNLKVFHNNYPQFFNAADKIVLTCLEKL